MSYEAALERLYFLFVFLGKFSMGLSLPCKRSDLTTLGAPPEREREMEGERERE